MADDLAGLGAAGAEAHAVDHAIEAPLEQTQQVLASDAFHVGGFFEVIAELGFEQPVNALGFLFFAKLQAVADDFRFAILAMLSGNEVTLFDCALLAVTALTFQKQFHALAPA